MYVFKHLRVKLNNNSNLSAKTTKNKPMRKTLKSEVST